MLTPTTVWKGEEAERRHKSRIPCPGHAIIAGVTLDSFGLSCEDLVLEVATKDVSSNGACIVGPRLLQVGQPVLFRMLMSSGCAISAKGEVARKRGAEPGIQCDWGIKFDALDVEVFQQYGVFDEAIVLHDHADGEVAVLVSNHPMELLWWYTRLAPSARVIFVGTKDKGVIQRMQKLDPTRCILSLW